MDDERVFKELLSVLMDTVGFSVGWLWVEKDKLESFLDYGDLETIDETGLAYFLSNKDDANVVIHNEMTFSPLEYRVVAEPAIKDALEEYFSADPEFLFTSYSSYEYIVRQMTGNDLLVLAAVS